MFVKRLFNSAPEGAGGGSAGADGDGEKPLTHEAVHGAISDRFKRFEGKLEERFKASQAENVELKTQLAAILEKLSAPAPDAKPAKGGESDEAKQYRLAAEKMQKRMDAMEAERAAEKAKLLADEERNELQRALVDLGVTDSKQQKLAMIELYTEQKRVRRDTDGKLMFRAPDKYGEETDYEFADGFRAWAQTDAAKGYLPPKPVSGTGAKPSTKRATSPSKGETRAERVASAENTIFEQMRGVFTGE